jgi:hypothetical protein
MDTQRFDEITRTLAAATSRRTALKLLGGGALASLGALLRPEGAGACRRFKSPCSSGSQCCSGRCSAAGRCACPTGRKRCGDRCCPAGQTCCDPLCGTCTPPGAVCVLGC